MALGTTNISTASVNSELGSPYSTPRIVRSLCQYSGINPCSFGRPGLWDIGSTGDRFIFFQSPRGLSYTDPRGSYNGSDKESYNLGDFRMYNHSAITPYGSFPSSTIQYGSTVTSATTSVTVYVGEMDWKQSLPAHYSENNWPIMTYVHLLDASDNSIVGSSLIPSSGGDTSFSVSISMPTAGIYSETYHIAFGIDATHWSFKMGSAEGLGGIGTITVQRLAAAKISGLIFDDTSITGGANPPYTGISMVDSGTFSFVGDTAYWIYSPTINGIEVTRYYYPTAYYRNITATWYIKGFVEDPSKEYLVKTASFASAGANNNVDLSTMSATPPRYYWKDGDEITLILRNISINY